MPALFSATELCLAYGTQVLMDGATLAIEPRDKVGLVGRNGCGKSSFLKIAAGLENADSGDIARSQALVVGYLAQDFTLNENLSVGENIRAGAAHVLEMLEKFETGKGGATEIAALQDRIDAADGWNLDARVKVFVDQLGAPDPERGLEGLSGGEKRRVALCRALVSRPDLLILDEPTNHLDAESIAWLEDYLIQLPAAVLFVTHDRYFLDRIATRVVELAGGRFFAHDGNYSDYLAAKAGREQREQAREAKRQRFLRSELNWVRAGVQARTTKSRHRLESFYKVAAQDAPEQELEMELVIPPPPKLGNIIVEAENLGHVLGGKELLHHLDLGFEAGTCTGVVGRNGLGKTTLLRLLMGEMPPDTGEVRIGKRTEFNYIDQNRVQLDGSKSVLDEVAGETDHVTFGDAKISVRAYLRRFLFSDHRINERVDRLSGGEQNRVLLAKILRKGGNFLILDEPTNDLDLPTLRVLEEAIVLFDGVVLAVSHDRYFLDRICDRIVAFEGDGKVVVQKGNYSYYRQKRTENAKPAPTTASKPKESRQKRSSAPEDKPRKLKWKEERELEALEPKIAEAEARAAEIEQTFADPDFYKNEGHEAAASLTEEREALAAEIEKLYARWEELERIRDASASD